VLFNSEPYMLFLPAVVVVTWALPPRLRPVFLLAASYFFYASWNPPVLLLIVFLTLANYVLGRFQGNSTPRRRSLVVAGVAINLVALAIFKYLGFMDDSVNALARFLGLDAALPAVRIILPLGLSFFTFEFIHYQIDLYRGTDAIRDPIRFALFPAFFPTQIAGPIKRYEDFDEQVRRQPRFDLQLFLEGIELVALGLFKKIVVADSLARIPLIVFTHPGDASSFDAILASLAGFLQLYYDFSGYTDIGRGSAQLLGYRIPINFKGPFLVTSVSDFWQRWHMSLSFWLRDYLFTPLMGSRFFKLFDRRARVLLALALTMTLAGLWHGAAGHFILFGFMFGVALLIDRFLDSMVFRKLPKRLRFAAGWIECQLVIVSLFLLFAVPVKVGWVLYGRMLFGGPHFNLLGRLDVLEVLGVWVVGIAAQWVLSRWEPREWLSRLDASIVLRPAYVTSLSLLALYFAIANAAANSRFIYFQF
jgi:alginate O-acetyltransferase complex protein AlgI